MNSFTSIMGLCVGVGLLLIVGIGYKLVWRGVPEQGTSPAPPTSWAGWSITLTVTGVILTVSGGIMYLFYPLDLPGEQSKNFIFGEPSAVFGLLLIAAAAYLWRRGNHLTLDRIYAVLSPIALLVGGIGLVMASNAVGALGNQIFETAPECEPVLGTWPSWIIGPVLTTIITVLPGLGCLAFSAAAWSRKRAAWLLCGTAWTLAGIGLVALGAFVAGAHIFMEYCALSQ
ncbi:DUF981 family protein [Polymorphospora sp. NPDC050346]|uniref:DUF981 family protein n=1 Tax=Polymorphospora sp. NPDC050346 TaxID=3155780 RepID=UPI0033F141FD